MQISSRLLYKTAIVLLGLMLLVSLVVISSSTRQANALSGSEWTTVKTAINDYFVDQYNAGAEGEAGYIMDAVTVKSRIDSDGDMVLSGVSAGSGTLDEGDDAANAPVLVDVLSTSPSWIPGTSVRGMWSNADSVGILHADKIAEIKAEVDQHREAGFATDVSVYCATGHTEAPATGGLGFVANASDGGGSYGLGEDALGNPADVYAFKWGRNGWQNTTKTYSYSATMGAAASATSTTVDAAQSNCTGGADSELVRCIAQWAITTTGGGVGNGTMTPLGVGTSRLPVDIRTPSPGSTIVNTGGPGTIQVPIDTLFNTGFQYMLPVGLPQKMFIGRTQHVPGMAAEAAEMLGYNAGFYQWGMPNWDSSLDEKWVAAGSNKPLVTTAEDTMGPTQSGINSPSQTATTAVIERDASEAASMKVRYGTTSGGPYPNTVNDTVLNKTDKQVTLTGLYASTTYYYVVDSYDGMANPSGTSAQYSFMTASGEVGKPTLYLDLDPTYDVLDGNPNGIWWASPADFLADLVSVGYIISNPGSNGAYDVRITGAGPTNSVTLNTTTPIVLGNVAGAGGTVATIVKYDTNGYTGTFQDYVAGSAKDQSGNSYTYPPET